MERCLTLDNISKLDHPLPDIRLRWLLYILKGIKHFHFKNHVIIFTLILKLSEWITNHSHIEEQLVLETILYLVRNYKNQFSTEEIRQLVSFISYKNHVLPEHLFLVSHIEAVLTGYANTAEIRERLEVDSTKESSDNYSELSFAFSAFPQYQVGPKDLEKINQVVELLQNGYIAQGCAMFSHDLLLTHPPEVYLHFSVLIENILGLLVCDRESIKFNAIGSINLFSTKLINRSKSKFVTVEYAKSQDSGDYVASSKILSVEEFCIKVFKLVLNFFKDRKYNNCQEFISFAFQEVFSNTVILLKTQSIHLDKVDDLAEDIATVISILRNSRNLVIHNILYFHFLKAAGEFCKTTDNLLLLSELEESVLDPVLEFMHSDIHSQIISVVSKFNSPILKTYENVKKACRLLDSAMDLIKHNERSHSEALDHCVLSVSCVKILNSFTLVERIILNCSKNHEEEQLLNTATNVILKLLSYKDEKIKLWVYTCIFKQVKQVLGVHKTKFFNGLPKLSMAYTGVPINSEIIVEIACRGTQHQNSEISSLASNILILLLKSNMTLHPNHWSYVLGHIIPALPIIQCVTDKETTLGRNLYDLVNPDVATKINFRYGDILKSNIRLLFSKDPEVRQESISRLLYLLEKRSDSATLLPKCSSIAGTLHSNLCIHTDNTVRLGAHSKEPLNLHSVTAINPLLEIISDEKSDSALLKSSLLQLSIILDDWFLHGVFSTIEDIQIFLKLLPKMLALDGFKDYCNSLVAIISILRKLCAHNRILRNQLAESNDAITYILRVLFLLYENAQLRLDCSQLLFMICWSTWLINDLNGLSGHFILENMHLPCSISFHDQESVHAPSLLEGKLLNSDTVKTYIKLFVHMGWFDNNKEVLEYDIEAFRADINENLLLDQKELSYLMSSSCTDIWKHYLHVMKNAKSHTEVRNALYGFSCISNLHYPEDSQIKQVTEQLEKFTQAPPASKSDKILFTSLLHFLKKNSRCDKPGGRALLFWGLENICNTSGPTTGIIKNFNKLENLDDALHVEILSTITSIYKEFSKLDDAEKNMVLAKKNVNDNAFNLQIIQLFVTMEVRISYIVRCTRLMLCICYINLALIKEIDIIALVNKLINWLWLLNDEKTLELKIFENKSEHLRNQHPYTNDNNFFSNVTVTLIRCLIVTLSNAIQYMKINSKQSESIWFEELENSVVLLSSLCTSSDTFVRSCSYQILSGLLYTGEGSLLIMKKFKYHFGTFWFTCLNTLVDNNESLLTRYQSGCCIVNLSSHITLDIKEMLCSFATQHLLDGYDKCDIIKHLLAITEFEKSFDELISSLFIDSSESSVTGKGDSRIKNGIYEDWGSIMPDLIRVFVLFLHNLTFISSNIVEYLHEKKILSNLLRCVRYEISETDKSVEKLITAICHLFSCCITINKNIGTSLELDPGSMYYLVSMADSTNGVKYKLFCGIYHLFSQLVKSPSGCDALLLAIKQFDEKVFLKTLYYSLLQDDYEELKICAFMFTTHMLQNRKDGKDFYNILDTTEYVDEDQMCPYRIRFIEIMVDFLRNQFLINETISKSHLFETLINCLCCCLFLLQHESSELKALHDILLQRLNTLFQNLNDKCAENLKKLLDKKRQPEAEEIKLIFKLLSYFYTNLKLKNYGLSFDKNNKVGKLSFCNIVHKLMPYCLAEDTFLYSCLECLHNYIEQCLPACRDMTNAATILYSRPAASSTENVIAKCVLLTIINLIIQNNSKTHKKHFMKLLLLILKSSCQNVEGRLAIYKSDLLSHFKFKSAKGLPDNYLLWLEFLQNFTKYPEGQLSIIKHNELLSVLIISSENKSKLIRMISFEILRNVSFNSSNKIILLNSKNYLSVIIAALKRCDLHEVIYVLIIIWNLSANNQKAKCIMKSHNIHEQIVELNMKIRRSSEDFHQMDLLKELLADLQCILNKSKDVT